MQRLHSHRDQECVERADAHTHVPQSKGAGRYDEGKASLSLGPKHTCHWAVFAKCFVHLQAVVGVAWLRQNGELSSAPVEVAFLDDEAAHGIAMSTERLGGTVHYDVSTVLKWSKQVRRGSGVIHNKRDALLVRNLCQLLQVHNKSSRISNRLAVKCLRLLCESLLDCIEIVVGTEGDLPAKLLELASELSHRPSVELVCSDKVVTSLQQVAEGKQLCSMARRHC
mmetsp:Transcript_81590/g.144079  ORF Transcript_81590/g.144079 Transcript_81590/m.144079 type:complete len:225 (+) Transcript_81590:682-1356(+)